MVYILELKTTQATAIKIVTDAINSLLTDEHLHARLVANCEKAKLEYNWQIESQKLLMIYRGVAAI